MWPENDDGLAITTLTELRADMNAHFAAVRGRLHFITEETAVALATQRNRELEQQLAESQQLAATRLNQQAATEIRLQAVSEERDRLWALLNVALRAPAAIPSASAGEFSATPGTAFPFFVGARTITNYSC
jgi:hypothetical protein